MDWVRNEDYATEADKPRILTTEEISFILSHLPAPPAADQESALVARECVVAYIKSQLSEILLCPSSIPDLISLIVKFHNDSLVIPGTAVGCNAGEAIGATSTQMTLNSVAPWEQILIISNGIPSIVRIGAWIDQCIKDNAATVVVYPENHTEYCPLTTPVDVCSPDDNGHLRWSKVTAVTRHDVTERLINIQTVLGRSVTVSASKSLLVWNGSILEPIEGNKVQLGDRIPIIAKLPAYNTTITPLTRDLGVLFGLYLCTKDCDKLPQNARVAYLQRLTEENGGKWTQWFDFTSDLARQFDRWTEINDPVMYFSAGIDFISGVIDGFLECRQYIHNSKIAIVAFTEVVEYLSFCCSQVGLVGQMTQINSSTSRFTLDINDFNGWTSTNPEISSSNTSTLQMVNDICLDEIVQIRYITPCKVYDLTVPETLNFSLYNGLCVRDTFHQSGSAKTVSHGISAMKSLIFAGLNNPNESCTILFKDKTLSFEQVLNQRHVLVGSMVADFVKDHDIDYVENLEKYWWHEHFETIHNRKIPKSTMIMRLYLNLDVMCKQKVTIADIAKVLENEDTPSVMCVYGPLSAAILDIYPDPTKIVAILNTSKKLQRKKKSKEGDTDDMGELETKNLFGHVDPDFAEKVFLESIVLKDLDTIKVKGITGIKEIYPVVRPVLSIVADERPIERVDFINAEVTKMLKPYTSNGWAMFYNSEIVKSTGITTENLAALCSAAGFEIIAAAEDRLYVAMPEDRFTTKLGDVVLRYKNRYYRQLNPANLLLLSEDDGQAQYCYQSNTIIDDTETFDEGVKIEVEVYEINGKKYRNVEVYEIDGVQYELMDMPGLNINQMKPREYILKKILADKRQRMAEVNRLLAERKLRAEAAGPGAYNKIISKPVIVPKSRLINASGFIYAVTEGSNLRELLTMPGIDTTRTTCNNMHRVFETFGIEAARTFIIREFINIISGTDSYVNPVHPRTIAEYMTSRGEPAGATYSGISRQRIGHLTLATVERAGKVFSQSAIASLDESTKNVSASVVLGTRMSVGSGSVDVGQDVTINDVTTTLLNDEVYNAIFNRTEPEREEEIDLDAALSLLNDNNRDFDNVGDDNNTNLLSLYDNNEIDFSKVTSNKTVEARNVRKLVNEAVDVPVDLLDMLSTIKMGFATNNIAADTVEISTTFRSSGLITDEIDIPTFSEEFMSQELESLLTEYNTAVGALSHKRVDLPSVGVPTLPNLDGFDKWSDQIRIRAKQVTPLSPADGDLM